MQILKDIIEKIPQDGPIREIRQGAYWTAVTSIACGLASVAFDEECPVAPIRRTFDGIHPLESARTLASFSLSPGKEEASLGLASLNSLIKIDKAKCVEKNASEILASIGDMKNVTIIGHFPFVEDLKKKAKNLWVVERRLQPGDVPDKDMEKVLSLSDVVAVSSTTLINHTLDAILALCKKESIKMLLGPTTPMSEVLFDYGIDYISGCQVVDEDIVLRLIRSGANFRELKRSGGIRLITMLKEVDRFMV